MRKIQQFSEKDGPRRKFFDTPKDWVVAVPEKSFSLHVNTNLVGRATDDTAETWERPTVEVYCGDNQVHSVQFASQALEINGFDNGRKFAFKRFAKITNSPF